MLHGEGMRELSNRELPRELWPPELRRDEVLGVYIGGCVERGEGSRFRAKAHAHSSGDYKGWLCFLASRRLADRALVLHELAHLLAGKGHTEKWRTVLLSLGGTLDEVPGLLKSYHKRAGGHRR